MVGQVERRELGIDGQEDALLLACLPACVLPFMQRRGPLAERLISRMSVMDRDELVRLAQDIGA